MKTVIEMAREAGWDDHHAEFDTRLKRFAELVRADEREACAKMCDEIYTGEEACGDWPTPEMCAVAIRARGEASIRSNNDH